MHPYSSKGSGRSLAVLYSLLGFKDNGSQGMSEQDRSTDNVECLNPLLCNDDSLQNRNNLGQRHHTALAEQNSGKKSLVERSRDGHVPSQGELVAGAFMGDATTVFKKGEKEKTMGPSLAKLSPICCTEIGLLGDVERSTGPYPPRSTTKL
ncbi:hypothetical protein Ancab_001582, partial [Ancistrocladus abbreviatus]